jgi:hypothetical protein
MVRVLLHTIGSAEMAQQWYAPLQSVITSSYHRLASDAFLERRVPVFFVQTPGCSGCGEKPSCNPRDLRAQIEPMGLHFE